jgi:F-type H+-transporting ATPase subunit epsilon
MFKLRIITPEKILFDGQAHFVEFKTVEGAMGTFQDRIPLITALSISQFEVEDENGNRKIFAIHGGIEEFFNNTLTVLSDAAERAEDIDVNRAKKALDKANTDIESVEDVVKRRELELKIQKALLRLKISQKRER